MTDIFLCGAPEDGAFCGVLLPALARFGEVRYMGASSVRQRGGGERRFLVHDCIALPSIDLKSGIVFFKNSYRSSEKTNLPLGFLAVFESRNLQAAAALRGSVAPAVTCGTGPRDTLTLTSLDDRMAALSLQRGLQTLTGEFVEPHDFNVTCESDTGPRQLLAAGAVLLLTGVPSSAGYVI